MTEVTTGYEADPLNLALPALFDPNTPTSMENLAPLWLKRAFRDLFNHDKESWEHIEDEDNLAKYLLEKYHYKPTLVDNRVRISLWHEYERALTSNSMIDMNNVWAMNCNEVTFKKAYPRHIPRALWLFCKPTSYANVVRESLDHGMKRLREILDLPHIEKNGKINTKILELKLKVTAMLDMRIHGAPTQKIQQMNTTLHLGHLSNAPGGGKSIDQLVLAGDLKTIKKRIEEIDSKARKLDGSVVETMKAEVVPVKRD